MLDAYTFTNNEVITISNKNLIPIKINADTDYGINLFTEYNGTAYPLIIFIDNKGKEIDRFYGYLPAYEFIIKINNALSNSNSLSSYLEQYNKGNHSAELIKLLADKYSNKGEYEKAINLFKELLLVSNQSIKDNEYAKYAIATLELKNNNLAIIDEYLLQNVNSSFFEQAKNEYSNYLNKSAWDLAEKNSNLEDALKKINKGIKLINSKNKSYPYLLDTKAEILWKLNQIDEAIEVINKAILLDPESQYYKTQKEKFLNSNL